MKGSLAKKFEYLNNPDYTKCFTWINRYLISYTLFPLLENLENIQKVIAESEATSSLRYLQGGYNDIKIVKKDGYWNYDKSEFDRVAPLLDDDDALEAIWKKEYSLTAITAADQFKSYEDLERRMNYVLGLGKTSSPTQSRAVMEQEDELDSYTQSPSREERVMEELEESYSRAKSPSLPKISQEDDDEDDALSYFQKLAED